MQGLVDTVATGVLGTISAGAVTIPASQSSSEYVQIAGIISSCLVALAHIVFGYLIYKNQKDSALKQQEIALLKTQIEHKNEQ
jgi:TRAP-type C4-dicarboxylate transport system permease small subunit